MQVQNLMMTTCYDVKNFLHLVIAYQSGCGKDLFYTYSSLSFKIIIIEIFLYKEYLLINEYCFSQKIKIV